VGRAESQHTMIIDAGFGAAIVEDSCRRHSTSSFTIHNACVSVFNGRGVGVDYNTGTLPIMRCLFNSTSTLLHGPDIPSIRQLVAGMEA
jgi:hypothetical protein